MCRCYKKGIGKMKKQAIMGLALMLLMGCSSQKIETEKKEPMLTFQDIKEVEYG